MRSSVRTSDEYHVDDIILLARKSCVQFLYINFNSFVSDKHTIYYTFISKSRVSPFLQQLICISFIFIDGKVRLQSTSRLLNFPTAPNILGGVKKGMILFS